MSNEAAIPQHVIDEFVIAAHHDLPKVHQMLDAQPALLNENASWVETPLGAAAHVANRPIAEFLLARGAPLDICTAAMLGHTEAVATFLADEPALIEATGAHDIPLLFHAAIGGSLDTVRLLVERGADVNAGMDKNTALHGAALFGQLEIARYLLEHGADPEAPDHQGRLPLDLAEDAGHEDMAMLMREHLGID